MRLTLQVDPTSRGELDEAIRQLTVLRDSLPQNHAAKVPHILVPIAVAPADKPTGSDGGESLQVAAVDPGAVFAPPAAEVFKPAPLEVAATAPAAAGTTAAPALAPVASAPSGVEVDKTGLPWDGRIHASTKVKNADGTWRARRGLNDAALVQRVEAELRGAMAAPPAPPVATAPPVAPPPALPAAVPVPPAPPAQEPSFPGSTEGGPVASVPGAPPVAPVQGEVTTFPEFMKRVSVMMAGSTPIVTRDEMNAVLQGLGIASLPLLASRADLIPAAWAGVEALRLSKPSAGASTLPPGATLQ